MGYECYLGSKDEIHRLFEQVKPFAYFDKGYHAKVSEGIYDTIKKNEGSIINLDEEGGVDFKDFSTISARYPEKVFQICDLIFLWGVNQYQFLKHSREYFSEDKVVVSGHPRFDILKQPFHSLYEQASKALRSRYKRYVLINTNMGFGNNIWGDSFVRKNYGPRLRELDKIIEFDKQKLERYISFVRRLAPVCDAKIILRPHPEESQVTYSKAFQDLKNVEVVFEGSVIPWILAAEVLIHPDCTTGIESLMLGKRSISYLPDHQDNVSTYLPIKLSHACHDEDELIDLILERRYPSYEGTVDPLLNEYFSFENDSTDIVVDRVHRLLCKYQSGSTKELSYFYPVKGRIKDILRPYYFRLKKRDIDLYQNKAGGLDPGSVTAIFDIVNTILSMQGRVELQSITSSLNRIRGRK